MLAADNDIDETAYNFEDGSIPQRSELQEEEREQESVTNVDQLVLQVLNDDTLSSSVDISNTQPNKIENSCPDIAEDQDLKEKSDDEDEEDHDHSYAEYMPLPDNDENAGPPSPILLTSKTQFEIPDRDLEIIRNTMASIHIPETAIPDWAKMIPETAWLPKFRDEKMD